MARTKKEQSSTRQNTNIHLQELKNIINGALNSLRENGTEIQKRKLKMEPKSFLNLRICKETLL